MGGGGGGGVVGGRAVGERSAFADWALSPFPLVLLYFLAAEIDKWKFCEARMIGESQLRRSRV